MLCSKSVSTLWIGGAQRSLLELLSSLAPIVALERDARQEPRDALFLLHPVPHQMRQVLGAAISLSYELHLHALTRARQSEHERSVEVVLRRHVHQPVWIELRSKDRRRRFPELCALRLEDLHDRYVESDLCTLSDE